MPGFVSVVRIFLYRSLSRAPEPPKQKYLRPRPENLRNRFIFSDLCGLWLIPFSSASRHPPPAIIGGKEGKYFHTVVERFLAIAFLEDQPGAVSVVNRF